MYERANLESILPKLDSAGLDLLSRLLEYAPEKRLAASDALNHPWLAKSASA